MSTADPTGTDTQPIDISALVRQETEDPSTAPSRTLLDPRG